jgi:oxygen-independent coproporphyrinogen-3 oxidase
LGAGLYVHIPFCVHRCGYCDFVTWADRSPEVPAYLTALGAEARRRRFEVEGLETVFLGGGTPSLLGPDGLRRLLRQELAPLQPLKAREITCECNPESVNSALVEELLELGVNRVSLGVQSFLDHELETLERAHDAAVARSALELLRNAGMPRLSLDLIYGFPGQTLETWLHSLEIALELDPGHISFYGLTVEAGSRWGREGLPPELGLPDGDLQADMYQLGLEAVRAVGYQGYEISNFSRPGLECLHNLKYWRCEPVLGLGVGAWGYREGVRVHNSASLSEYLKDQSQGRGPHDVTKLDFQTAARERVLLGLRLGEGVELEAHLEGEGLAHSLTVMEHFRGLGLVEVDSGHWRLTDRGRMLANEVMVEFL